VRVQINPALIGGFVVEVGSSYKANFAVATQFDHMRQQLKQAEEKWFVWRSLSSTARRPCSLISRACVV
jgi:hypothetical protein